MDWRRHPTGFCCYTHIRMDGRYQGIYNNRYTLSELLERVSVGKTFEADSNLPICVNFKVFSFVMTYTNKKDGAIFGCHITFCVPSTFNSENSQYLKIFRFNLIDFMCFGDTRNSRIIQYCTKSMVVFFFLEN